MQNAFLDQIYRIVHLSLVKSHFCGVRLVKSCWLDKGSLLYRKDNQDYVRFHGIQSVLDLHDKARHSYNGGQ